MSLILCLLTSDRSSNDQVIFIEPIQLGSLLQAQFLRTDCPDCSRISGELSLLGLVFLIIT